jgi:hypothetical protein
MHSHITALMRGEMVPKTLVLFNKLTWLIVWEHFINGTAVSTIINTTEKSPS